jgi:hypothetical protein
MWYGAHRFTENIVQLPIYIFTSSPIPCLTYVIYVTYTRPYLKYSRVHIMKVSFCSTRRNRRIDVAIMYQESSFLLMSKRPHCFGTRMAWHIAVQTGDAPDIHTYVHMYCARDLYTFYPVHFVLASKQWMNMLLHQHLMLVESFNKMDRTAEIC